MLPANVEKVLSTLSDADLVLDVGGWACPFNRAQWILDAEPFETRGFYSTFGGQPSQGGEKEWFTKDTWVQRDFCDREPWPFRDKQFDFAICSHTLEDVRDPVGVCRELVRVAKRGYIEVPARKLESCRGLERPGMVGLSHHRWFVDIQGSTIRFIQKYHFVHSHWRYSFPRTFADRMPEEERTSVLFWDESFEATEVHLHGIANIEYEVTNYIQSIRPYSSTRLALARVRGRLIAAIRNRLPRGR